MVSTRDARTDTGPQQADGGPTEPLQHNDGDTYETGSGGLSFGLDTGDTGATGSEPAAERIDSRGHRIGNRGRRSTGAGPNVSPSPSVEEKPKRRSHAEVLDVQAGELADALCAVLATACSVVARIRHEEHWLLQPQEIGALQDAGKRAIRHLPVPTGDVGKYADYAFAATVVGTVFIPKVVISAALIREKHNRPPYGPARNLASTPAQNGHAPEPTGAGIPLGADGFGQDVSYTEHLDIGSNG